MKQVDNNERYLQLREECPYFIYQSYSFKIKKKHLSIEFRFDLAGKFHFKPKLKILKRKKTDFDNFTPEALQNLVFHIGMIELISYWKTCCSPEIIIEPHYLDDEQLHWWKKLYFNGLGEFFYLNGIDSDWDNFVNIKPGKDPLKILNSNLSDEKVLIPVGGGKDSAVTLELFNDKGLKVIPFAINPREAIIRTIESAGYSIDDSWIIKRKIDPLLLEMNKQGFLNGHTPFSALLAFISVLSAEILGAKYIALSNESSANQSTVPGSTINHQYSKSFEFEHDFNWYLQKYIHPKMQYFSFLRPLNELQIAMLFSKYPWHFEGFRSCNAGSKTDSWCGHCAKCLFTYSILSPFLSQATLERIFHKNLLNDNTLSKILDELTGISLVKPFECVGTPEEVTVALNKTVGMMKKQEVPVLLKKYYSTHNQLDSESKFQLLIHTFNKEHHVPDKFSPFLITSLNE